MAAKEYTLKGHPTIIPGILIVQVFNPDESYLGEAVITIAQFKDPKAMDLLIKDMETMRSKGIEMAFILPEEKGVYNG